jgi:hypothetical protein
MRVVGFIDATVDGFSLPSASDFFPPATLAFGKVNLTVRSSFRAAAQHEK